MLDEKVVLITGGTSGIGLGTIEYLLDQDNYEIISLSRGDKNLSLAKQLVKNKIVKEYMKKLRKNIID